MTPAMRERLAGMHQRNADGSLTPLDFELPADPELHMGGHGLYATVGDYMRFIRMWLNDGDGENGRVLKPETVKMAAAWVGIFAAGFVIFSFRSEFMALGSRLQAESVGTPIHAGEELQALHADVSDGAGALVLRIISGQLPERRPPARPIAAQDQHVHEEPDEPLDLPPVAPGDGRAHQHEADVVVGAGDLHHLETRLLPRLGDFYQKNPEVDLRFSASRAPTTPRQSNRRPETPVRIKVRRRSPLCRRQRPCGAAGYRCRLCAQQ